MFLFLILGLSIFGNGVSFQNKYDHCKSIEFKSEYCEFQKKVSKYELKK